jgi:hypothetical protein
VLRTCSPTRSRSANTSNASQNLIFIQHVSCLAQRSSRGIRLHEVRDPDRIWTQDTRSWKPQESPRRTPPYPRESQTHGSPVPCPQEASTTSYCSSTPPDEPRAVSGPPRVPDRPYNYLLELSRKDLETLNREILVIFADVPAQDGETDEQ